MSELTDLAAFKSAMAEDDDAKLSSASYIMMSHCQVGMAQAIKRAADIRNLAPQLVSEVEELRDENKALGAQHMEMLKMTRTLTTHPIMPDGELYDGPCECVECCSIGD